MRLSRYPAGLVGLVLASLPALADQQAVNTGVGIGTGTGDNLRVSFTKLNANDAELYARIATLQQQIAALQLVTGSGAVASGTILANLTGASATPVGNTLSAILDSQIGATRATIAVRSASTWGPYTPSVSGCTFQFNGTDTVCAAASPGTGAVRYDAAQGLTAGQQGQARSNIASAASGSNSDITALSGLTTALSVAQGGTGSTTAPLARFSLSAAASGANTDITSLAGPALGAATATAPAAADSSTRVPTTGFLTAATVRGDIAQSLTTTQQAQARTNIGQAAAVVASGGSAASSYRKWSDGLIEQWFVTNVSGDATVTLPQACTATVLEVLGTVYSSAYNANALTVHTYAWTATNFGASARVIGSGSVTTIATNVSFYTRCY